MAVRAIALHARASALRSSGETERDAHPHDRGGLAAAARARLRRPRLPRGRPRGRHLQPPDAPGRRVRAAARCPDGGRGGDRSATAPTSLKTSRPPESPPTASLGSGSPGRTRTSDQSVTPGPPFPAGVDYLITLGWRAACRWRALVGRLFFRHSLVSAPSLRPSLSEGLAQGSRMRAALRLP